MIDILMRPISPEEMKTIEEEAEKLGISRTLLMENAGHEIASHILKKYGSPKDMRITVVAGTGNNGGDGFVAARHLAPYGAELKVLLLGRPEEIKTEEASLNWSTLEKMKRSIRIYIAPDKDSLRQFEEMVVQAGIVIDAIFGTGIKGSIREPHSYAIDLINRSQGYKVAVDIPSGLDPKTGEVHDKAVKADVTITFHRVKTGLLDKRDFTGEVIVAPIGVPPEADVGGN